MSIFRRWFSFFNVVNQVSNRYGNSSGASRSFSRVIIRGNSKISNSQIGNVMINGKSYRGSNIGDIDIYGTVNKGITTTSGDVTVDSNVAGSISTVSGDVTASEIAGNVRTVSGDVTTKGGNRYE